MRAEHIFSLSAWAFFAVIANLAFRGMEDLLPHSRLRNSVESQRLQDYSPGGGLRNKAE